MIVPGLSLFPAFQAIQQFKSLPDFFMFPAFLTFPPDNNATSELVLDIEMEVIDAVKAFVSFTNEAQEQSQSTSDALVYACQYWAMHLSRAPNPWDDTLNHVFHIFWDHHLLSWLERQWCLRGLRSCLVILSEGQELAKVCIFSIVFVTQRLTCTYRNIPMFLSYARQHHIMQNEKTLRISHLKNLLNYRKCTKLIFCSIASQRRLEQTSGGITTQPSDSDDDD
jgi:hypothetical protein